MADGEDAMDDDAAPPPRRARKDMLPARIVRWIGIAVVAIVAILLLAVAWLHTGSGRQFIVDEISKVAPASGLSVEVGRIEGSVLWSATLFDVKLRDAEGVLFLEIPEVDLNWRPFKFPFTGLDVRDLVLHRGTLHAAPELIPGDPDAPILPNFDIRVDRFVIDDLRVAEGLLGEERMVDFRARADIRRGRVLLDGGGELGGGDTLALLIDTEPDRNRFDVDLDYRAPAGGLLATLVGAEEDLRARILGDGAWDAWDGAFVVTQAGSNVGAFSIYNRAGRYKIVGQARPNGLLTGIPARAVGEVASLAAVGTLQNSVLDGSFALRGAGLEADAEGAIDLGENAFDGLELSARLRDPELFGEALVMRDATLAATLDGPFRDLSAPHEIRISEMNAGGTLFRNLVQRGVLTREEDRFVLPLDVAAARIVSGNATLDPRLANGSLRGTVVLDGDALRSDNLALRFDRLRADLGLRGDLSRGLYALAGQVQASGLPLENLGAIDGRANVAFTIGSTLPWSLRADFDGRMPSVTNATLANIAGDDIRFSGAVSLGANRPILLSNTRLTASKLTLALDGRVVDGRTTIAGEGEHVDYGPFTVEAALADDGPRATLVFANPYPAAGLRDVRVALAPSEDGFRIETEGQSTLGPFDGLIDLVMPEDGPTRIGIQRLDVSRTSVTGEILLLDGGASGALTLAGGGIDGRVELAPRAGGQGFEARLDARNARFGGATPIAIARARVDASGMFGEGGATVNGSVRASGLSYGAFFIGRLVAQAQVEDGRGRFDAAMSGRRGSRFSLQLTGEAAPERIAVAARGDYAGRAITMPRRAVLLKTADGGWELQRTQVGFGGGFAIAEGRFGGEEPNRGRFSFADMPLSLIDAFAGDLGIGGTVSGIVDLQTGPDGEPTGEARVMVAGLTRSGLVLTSRPIDLALVASLTPDQLSARAVLRDGADTMGRLQARIVLPAAGSFADRLYAGDLLAQLRFEGPADALWRLSTIELIDISGDARVAADVSGTLINPQVRGSIAGDALRVQSALTGSDIRDVRARGRFSGSRLQLTSFAGTAPNGGRVSGSGFVDLAQMTGGRGPRIDLRLAMRNAEVMDLVNMGATVTGPMRIVSNGIGGTIAGRLHVNEGRWMLGTAEADETLPVIRTREINLPPDIQERAAAAAPWRFMIDANAPGGLEVDGMGLDSEWSADIQLRGTTADPRLGGEARVVPRQGFYSFAGVRFDITRGEIDFDLAGPIDPLINIVAETEVDDLSVMVTVSGSSTRPDIAFASTPALPEEELLARLLYGDSITSLSATDALQLGAALASLRGGGGLDPINQLRTSIGLDRLRIVPADPALDRGTAIALGKNFGRRFYVEVVTDGRGYNATEGEFRVTGWLSLLASINTLGRHSVAAEYRRDY